MNICFILIFLMHCCNCVLFYNYINEPRLYLLTIHSDWIKALSETATQSFLRGLALGVELDEAWLVCCAATYVWNYNNHVLTQLRHREILETLTTVFDGLKKVGHAK